MSKTINNEALLELAKLSKQVETIISNDTLPLLTESIDGLGSGSIFSGAQRGPGVFFDIYGGSDAADSGVGGFGGEGGLPMVQTSQFLVDRGIKPRDLIESTETAVEAVQRTATICPASSKTTTTTAAGQAKASGEVSVLRGEVEQRVRGRILGLDEYVAAQRAAIQDYTVTSSLDAVDRQCAARCQELADRSWRETLTKFSGASSVTSSSAVSAYLSNLSAAMTPIFSPGSSSSGGTGAARKRKHDAAFEAQARGYATTVLAAYTQKKTFLEALAEEREEAEKSGSGAQASLEGTQGLWKILLRMFYPAGQRGGAGNGTVNNTTLYRNTLTFLGQYYEQTRGKRGQPGYGDTGSMWEKAYVSMLCNNYVRASEDIKTDSIAPALGDLAQGRQLSKVLLNEAVVRLGEIRPDRDIYQYAVLSIIAKRRDSLKVLQSFGLIKTVVDAAWFILSTYQGLNDYDLNKALRQGFATMERIKSGFREEEYLKSYLLFQRFGRFADHLFTRSKGSLGAFGDAVHFTLAIWLQCCGGAGGISEYLRNQNYISEQTPKLVEQYVAQAYPGALDLRQALAYLSYTAGGSGPAHLCPIFEEDLQGHAGVARAVAEALSFLPKSATRGSFRLAAEELVARGRKETAFYVLLSAGVGAANSNSRNSSSSGEGSDADLAQLLGAVLGDTLADPAGHRAITAFVESNRRSIRVLGDSSSSSRDPAAQRLNTLLGLCSFFDCCERREWDRAVAALAALRLFPLGDTPVSAAVKAVMGPEFPQEAQRSLPKILEAAMTALHSLWAAETEDRELRKRYCEQAAKLVKFAGVIRSGIPKETLAVLAKHQQEMH